MGVQLDIAGNFAAGQQAMIDRRRAKQLERARDYELAAADDEFMARRSDMEYAGWDPEQMSGLQTNQDPWFMRLRDWWKERRATRMMPSRMMPEQQQSVQDEMDAVMQPAQTFPMRESGPVTAVPYKDGGRVRAIPRYQDGGGVGEPEMARRRRQAEFRRQGIQTRTAQTGRGGAIPREGVLRRTTNALRGRGVSAAGRGRAVRGGAIAAGAAVLPQLDENYDQRMNERFGWEEFPDGSAAAAEGSVGGFAKYFGRRALGYASDLGNMMTGGLAGNLYRDSAIPGEAEAQEAHKDAAKPAQPEEAPPTPDEAIAQAAIADGTRMAQQATAGSKPPGAIDFSQVDFDASELPSMGVKDWVGYREQSIRSLTARGVPVNQAYEQAMKSVTTLQQQGFIDYAQQALMHMQGGNPRAAANAMRAAYQYFPNGADVKIGVQQGQDGQPVLVGVGVDEETGEPKGQPMILNDERLAVMIENFSNPNAFRSWTKDWRAEELDRRKYEEVEKPEAQSEAIYRDRTGRAALRNAEANVIDAQRQAAGQGRRQVDLDRANEAFQEATFEMVSEDDPGQAERITALMSRIYARKPNMQYTEVIDFVKEAARRGDLEKVMTAAGIGE